MTPEEEQYHTPFEYINKDLDLLFILIFLEAYHEGKMLLNFADFFKGNYWDVSQVKDEILDTNDYQSIPDMVLEQSVFIFQDLRMGKVTEVGIDDPKEALKDLMIEVAKIGSTNAAEQAPHYADVAEHLCFLQRQEEDLRRAKAEKNPQNYKEIMQYDNPSVFFQNEGRGYFRAVQPIVIDLPQHILIRVQYRKVKIELVEKEISSYLKKFADDKLINELPTYQEKRPYFAQQIESFYRYINRQSLIGNVVNIPFTILAQKDFEAVKILKFLQENGAIKMRWSDEGSWKVEFTKVPITPNSLISHDNHNPAEKPEGSLKKILSFDTAKSVLMVGQTAVKIRPNTDQFHFLRIIFANPIELAREWFYSEIAEEFDAEAKFDDKKFYNALYQVEQKLARDARVNDVFITTTQSFTINPKYLNS